MICRIACMCWHGRRLTEEDHFHGCVGDFREIRSKTPLYFAERLSEKYGTKIYLKREDLNHTGAHKINNVIGQILLAKRICGSRIRMSYRNAWKKPASDLFTIYRNCSVPSQF